MSAGAAATEALRLRQEPEPNSPRGPERPGKEGAAAHSRGAPSSPGSPLSSRAECGTQATPPPPHEVRSPRRSGSSAHLRTDEGEGERGAASEPGAMSGEGGYNFRRVAIRRKSSPSYLPPGTPRPWSRPSPHLGRAEPAAFRSQAPADGAGECLEGQGWAGAWPPVEEAPGALQVCGSAGC